MKKLFTLIAIVLMAFTAQAKTLTIGEGGTYYRPLAPFNATYYNKLGSISQVIYPSYWLTDLVDSEITELRFYAYEPMRLTGGKLKFSLKIVEQEYFTSNSIINVADEDACGYVVPVYGESEFVLTLDEPFMYEGGHLLLSTEVVEAGDYSYYSVNWQGMLTYYNYSICRWTSNNEVNYNREAYVPTTTFDYLSHKTENPVIVGHPAEGSNAYNVEISPVEPSTIYYRVRLNDGEFSEWAEYTDVLNFADTGHYYLEAYALAQDKNPSETVSCEFLVVDAETITVNGVSFNMMKVDGGTFMMGATDDDAEAIAREKPLHEVTVSDFCIGETEVTQALWVAVMGDNPSNYAGEESLPVEQVSWDDCQLFIAKLNELTGREFRLPTEAEWEFAARGGNLSQGSKFAGGNDIEAVAWYRENANDMTHLVATKTPNELGLYDMSGNVFEWVQDWYGSNYYANSPLENPTGPETGSLHLARGGGWYASTKGCRVCYRLIVAGDFTNSDTGLRLALTPLEQTESPIINGHAAEGTNTYIVEMAPNEPSTIYYRVKIDDGEFGGWLEYDDALTFSSEGRYYIEAYAVAEGKAPSETVYYEFVISPSPITGINELANGKTVTSIRYFNAAGQEIARPVGLTIVVTTYTDGSTSAAKVVK